MSNELLIASHWRVKPRGFIALMQLYESNYLRLRQLCGDPARLPDECRSTVADGCDLRLQVLDRCAYTVTLRLTHLFEAALPTPMNSYPDARLVVYCDARLVQAQDYDDEVTGRAPPSSRAVADGELRQRWARNIMLNKWLEYCLELGHAF